MNKVTKPVEEEKPLKDATIGERIDYVRRKKGLSQKDLGKAVGVEDKTIKRYENNKANILHFYYNFFTRRTVKK